LNLLNLNCFMSSAWVATGKYCAVALLRIVEMFALHEENLW
jgi:hypothetical protein